MNAPEWLIDINVSAGELVAQGTLMYWFLLLLGFRFVMRRDPGSRGVADILFVVTIADAGSGTPCPGPTTPSRKA